MRHLAQLGFAVIEAGHNQGDHLKPEAAFVHHADAFGDALQGAAEGAVALVVEALQVNLVSDNPGAQEVQHLGRGVAVGNEARNQAGGFGLTEYRDGPFGGDERFVVGADHGRRAL